ncbi:pantetheine-phosphate adenylyltransferase [Rubrobacter indicoceani]|uniref:pantetheine-phosphate adenylyltransferase n=1 Tax=Rubrobacter indicoceani TaxID=2051957 RepID=UPI000E5A9A77|nr:pantetheine-phosphate adenylyltransferase [Rubrobacter indicoceani]
MSTAIYPGSFDPPTLGHVDVAERAAGIFEGVVICVGSNVRKDSARLSGEERAALVRAAVGHIGNVEVEVMSGLLIDFARERDIRVVVKGLRDVRDFGAEQEQALLNRTMAPEIETVFVVSDVRYGFVSSSAVREISLHGGEVREMVPGGILEDVQRLYGRGERSKRI